MDAFSNVQQARIDRMNHDYDKSLMEFVKSSEIFRSTVHFGFMAGYVSGCAMLETGLEIAEPDEVVEAMKNAIALFEQSKLALGFQDERHTLINIIDSMIKYAISEAFLAESKSITRDGRIEESLKKKAQSELVAQDQATSAVNAKIKPKVVSYFPVADWKRVQTSGFIIAYPEANSLLLMNIGVNPIVVQRIGEDEVDILIQTRQSISCQIDNAVIGKIRVKYTDLSEGKSYDEGCLLKI
jgi:hypothetical protein